MAIKKAKVTIVEGKLIWEFADGEKVSVDPDQFSEEVQEHARNHGFKQKLSDCYAGVKTVLEAKAALKDVLEALNKGDWNKGRQSTGGLWVEALARAGGVDIETALEKWSAMSDEEQAAIKKHPQIKLAKQQIELERAEKAAENAEPLTFE